VSKKNQQFRQGKRFNKEPTGPNCCRERGGEPGKGIERRALERGIGGEKEKKNQGRNKLREFRGKKGEESDQVRKRQKEAIKEGIEP